MFTTQMLLNPISELEAFMSQYPFVRYREEDGKRILKNGTEFMKPIIGTMVAMDTAGGGANLAGVAVGMMDDGGNVFILFNSAYLSLGFHLSLNFPYQNSERI